MISIVDSHCHVGVTPKEFLLGDDLIKKMDRNKQDAAIIFPMMRGFEFSPPQYNPYSGNEYVAEVQSRFPKRIIGLAGIEPRFRLDIKKSEEGNNKYSSPVLKEIEYAIYDLNLNGIKLHPLLHAYSINDPNLVFPILDKLVEIQTKIKKRLYVVVHARGDSVNNTPEKLALVAKKYPMLTFAAAHLGHFYGQSAARSLNNNIVKECKNIIIDCSNVPKDGMIESLVKIYGASRVVTGSDEPFDCFESKMMLMKNAKISPKEKELVLSENLRSFFNL